MVRSPTPRPVRADSGRVPRAPGHHWKPIRFTGVVNRDGVPLMRGVEEGHRSDKRLNGRQTVHVVAAMSPAALLALIDTADSAQVTAPTGGPGTPRRVRDPQPCRGSQVVWQDRNHRAAVFPSEHRPALPAHAIGYARLVDTRKTCSIILRRAWRRKSAACSRRPTVEGLTGWPCCCRTTVNWDSSCPSTIQALRLPPGRRYRRAGATGPDGPSRLGRGESSPGRSR